MKPKFIATVLLLILTVSIGCTKQEPQKPEPKPNIPQTQGTVNPNDKKMGLVDIHLGDPLTKIEMILTGKYKEELIPAENGYFGEDFLIRQYDQGIDIVIGKSSKKVLQFTVRTAEFKTELGVKVGENAQQALKKYRLKYEEWVGNQSPDKLIGWFEIKPGEILILDFDDDETSKFNAEVSKDAKVQSITYGYIKYFD